MAGPAYWQEKAESLSNALAVMVDAEKTLTSIRATSASNAIVLRNCSAQLDHMEGQLQSVPILIAAGCPNVSQAELDTVLAQLALGRDKIAVTEADLQAQSETLDKYDKWARERRALLETAIQVALDCARIETQLQQLDRVYAESCVAGRRWREIAEELANHPRSPT
jgi:hypothetical protein